MNYWNQVAEAAHRRAFAIAITAAAPDADRLPHGMPMNCAQRALDEAEALLRASAATATEQVATTNHHILTP